MDHVPLYRKTQQDPDPPRLGRLRLFWLLLGAVILAVVGGLLGQGLPPLSMAEAQRAPGAAVSEEASEGRRTLIGALRDVLGFAPVLQSAQAEVEPAAVTATSEEPEPTFETGLGAEPGPVEAVEIWEPGDSRADLTTRLLPLRSYSDDEFAMLATDSTESTSDQADGEPPRADGDNSKPSKESAPKDSRNQNDGDKGGDDKKKAAHLADEDLIPTPAPRGRNLGQQGEPEQERETKKNKKDDDEAAGVQPTVEIRRPLPTAAPIPAVQTAPSGQTSSDSGKKQSKDDDKGEDRGGKKGRG